MDDNKEKLAKGVPEENGEPQTDTEPKGEYHDEMEELAKIFKQELDKAVQDAENAADVASADTIQVEGYQPDELSRDKSKKKKESLCELCGECPRGTEKNPDSPFCEQCESTLEKYPYDWKGIVAVVGVVAVALAAVFCFMLNTPLFSAMKQGDAAMNKNMLYSANAKYNKALDYLPEGSENDFLGLYARFVKIDYRLLNLSYAMSERDEYFSDSQLKLPAFRTVKSIGEEIDAMQVSTSAIQKRVNEKYSDITEKNYDEAIALLDSLSGKKIYEKKDGTVTDELDTEYTPDGTEKVYIYDEGWLNVYKYSVAQVCGKDDDVRIGFLEAAGNTSKYLSNVVDSMLSIAYISKGNYEKAEELAEVIRANNCEDESYYMVISMLYRYRDKDYTKAVAICDEGLDMISNLADADTLAPQISYTVSLQKALSLIMQEDYKTAYSVISETYEQLAANSSLTLEIRDLYALLALASGDNETFTKLEEEIKEYAEEGIDFSSDIADYRDGKLTLQEIATSGRYDLI